MKTGIRIFFAILILVAVIHGWWVIALPLALASTWFFRNFVEIILAGILFDALFGVDRAFGIFAYEGTIISVLTLFTVAFLKNYVRK